MAYTKGKQWQTNEHFTSDIDQDPKKQLVINVKLVTAFKSNVSVQKSSSLFSLTNPSQAELQGPVNTIYNHKSSAQVYFKVLQPTPHSSSTEVLIEEWGGEIW